MKPSDLTNKPQVDEAMPMGALSKLGQTVASKLPTFAPQTQRSAMGKLNAGKEANELMLTFKQWLSQSGEQPTKSSLIDFLKLHNYPTQKAETTFNVPAPSTVNTPTPQRSEPTINNQSNQSPELSLEPKELELMPKESTDFRKLLNLLSEAIAEPKLTSKQISNALLAAVQEKSRRATIQSPAQPTQQATPQTRQQPTTSTNVASNFVRATDEFIRAGGKLTPQMKQKLQNLINNS